MESVPGAIATGFFFARRDVVSTGSEATRVALWQPPCKLYYLITVRCLMMDVERYRPNSRFKQTLKWNLLANQR